MRSALQYRGLLLFAAILIHASFGPTTRAQDVTAPNVQIPHDHDPKRLDYYCTSVMCTGSNSYTVVKGMGNSYPGDLWTRVASVCPNGYTVDPQPVSSRVCNLTDVTDVDGFNQMSLARVAGSPSPCWKVHCFLCYCDGSPGRDIFTSGHSYCMAVQKGREALCEMKDPCKRGYLKFCVVKSPCSQ